MGSLKMESLPIISLISPILTSMYSIEEYFCRDGWFERFGNMRSISNVEWFGWWCGLWGTAQFTVIKWLTFTCFVKLVRHSTDNTRLLQLDEITKDIASGDFS